MIDSKYINTTPDETARFDFTRNGNKTQKRVELASNEIYGRGYGTKYDVNGDPIPFESLTKAQKIDVLGAYLNDVINNLAKEYLFKKNALTTASNSEQEFENNY